MKLRERGAVEIWAFYIFDYVDVVYFQRYDYVPVREFNRMNALSYVLLF